MSHNVIPDRIKFYTRRLRLKLKHQLVLECFVDFTLAGEMSDSPAVYRFV